MRRAVLIAALLALSAPAAHAGGTIWDRATADADERPSAAPPAGLSEYDKQMWFGDKASLTATERRMPHTHVSRVKIYLDYAFNAYEKAIAADPTQAEPHYRLGWLILYHYLDEAPSRGFKVHNPREELRWRLKLIEHWEKFVDMAPLDPRVDRLLASRSLQYTKLDTTEGNKKAIADYALLFERNDPSSFDPGEAGRLASNRAEIHMMLGQLAEAIEWYQRALSFQQDNGWAFGLAVAYDRAGYTSRAREIMSTYAKRGPLEEYVAELALGRVFYVPPGEVYYYYGLMHEVLGSYDLAIERFESYIASGAHPEFQPRAKHNIKLLKKKLRTQQRGSLGAEQWTRNWDEKWLPKVGDAAGR